MVQLPLRFYWKSSGKVLQNGREWGKPLDCYLKAFPQMEFAGNYAKSLNNFRDTDNPLHKNLCHPINKTSEFALLKNSAGYNAT